MFQIVYPPSTPAGPAVHPRFAEEAMALRAAGLLVGSAPLEIATRLMYKGFNLKRPEDYPTDPRYIGTVETYRACQEISRYYPYIEGLTMETFFVDELNDSVIAEVRRRGWSEAFIKREVMALEHIEEGKSVWPRTSLDTMTAKYDEFGVHGQFAIRKYMDPALLSDEKRYWVLNGRIYRRDNIVPDIVKQAVERLNRIGSLYYTVDATPVIVVEVNSGESSDRHAENSAELFASWIKKEFGT